MTVEVANDPTTMLSDTSACFLAARASGASAFENLQHRTAGCLHLVVGMYRNYFWLPPEFTAMENVEICN